jgi:O-acetylserine/cysteine efflux transporter
LSRYTFVPIKVALVEVPPFTLAALRFFLAAVPIVFFVRRPTMPWRDIVAYGFAIGVCEFGLLFLGLELGMPAGLSSLAIQVQVFFTIGLAVAFTGDHLRRHNLVGAAIAVVGILVLALYKVASGLTGKRSVSRSSSTRRSHGRSATSSRSAQPASTARTCSR